MSTQPTPLPGDSGLADMQSALFILRDSLMDLRMSLMDLAELTDQQVQTQALSETEKLLARLRR